MGVVARASAIFLASEFRHRLGDQRLTATGRAVQQNALGGRSECSRNSSLCRKGGSTASRICLDLSAQPADVGVVDVGAPLQDGSSTSAFGMRSKATRPCCR